MSFVSWGGLPSPPQKLLNVHWRDQVAAVVPEAGLVVGNGRSYGDVGLSSNGTVATLRGLNRVLAFDRKSGVLRCEAGATLGQLLNLVLPAGWRLPVLPGTQFVTVAGAIANDIHGKNHHHSGTFGRHVRNFSLQRSSGDVLLCSPDENSDWFQATIAGLGLTGIIVEVELQLVPAAGAWLDTENIKFSNLEEFFELSRESDRDFEYSVAWIDCLSKSTRGHFSRASHSSRDQPAGPGAGFNIHFTPPWSPVNRLTLRAFNSLYFHRQLARRSQGVESLYSWFFPLDRIGQWNRLYGRSGFRQYQCVVTPEAVPELLAVIRDSGQGSFLAVLKMFGDLESPGLLSFPRPGATLALDFPWRDHVTLDLFKRLDEIVASCEGALYPAKDAHMSGADFRRAYPAWETLEKYRDPALKSLLWQRVTEDS